MTTIATSAPRRRRALWLASGCVAVLLATACDQGGGPARSAAVAPEVGTRVGDHVISLAMSRFKYLRRAGDGSDAGPPILIDSRNGLRFVVVDAPGRPVAALPHPSHDPPFQYVELEAVTAPFLMAETEVTQRAWASSMGAQSSAVRGRDLPVQRVSWEEAVKFCRRYGYDLPTRAEWLVAVGDHRDLGASCDARVVGNLADATLADSPIRYDIDPVLDGEDAEYYDGFAGPAPVATFVANEYGLYDMIGNVAEWCEDANVETLPDESARRLRRASAAVRVWRATCGGSWASSRRGLAFLPVGDFPQQFGSPTIGFRPVLRLAVR